MQSISPDYKARKQGQPTIYIDLAAEYGVCKKTIMDAVKGKSWKCVNYFPAPPDRRPPEGEA